MKHATTVLILESLATIVIILGPGALAIPTPAAAAPSYQCIVTQSKCPALCAGPGGLAQNCKSSH
ncbi:hypothetical protein QBC42DRAFT_290287, partial [Cladorrhinum samala]